MRLESILAIALVLIYLEVRIVIHLNVELRAERRAREIDRQTMRFLAETLVTWQHRAERAGWKPNALEDFIDETLDLGILDTE